MEYFLRYECNHKNKIMTYVRLKKATPAGSFNNLFENIYAPFPFSSGGTQKVPALTSVPVNIIEAPDKYEVKLVAPGFGKEDFEVKLEKDLLTVSANYKKQESADNVKLIRSEYNAESFNRSFTLSDQVDIENISAEYLNGILVLTLSKKAPEAPVVKSINIQ
jgi:HSP20 family protein